MHLFSRIHEVDGAITDMDKGTLVHGGEVVDIHLVAAEVVVEGAFVRLTEIGIMIDTMMDAIIISVLVADIAVFPGKSLAHRSAEVGIETDQVAIVFQTTSRSKSFNI